MTPPKPCVIGSLHREPALAMRRSVTVREARPEDNDALIALDAACSMGEAVPLCFDRSPDFFARSAAYEIAVVLVAEAAWRGSLEARGEAAPLFLSPFALRDPGLWPAVLVAVRRAVAVGPRDAPPLLCRPVFLDPADL